jgi:hypothetical protein
MALRPVSELGLVDLTDLAAPPDETTTERRKPRAAGTRSPSGGRGSKTKTAKTTGTRSQKLPATPLGRSPRASAAPGLGTQVRARAASRKQATQSRRAQPRAHPGAPTPQLPPSRAPETPAQGVRVAERVPRSAARPLLGDALPPEWESPP